MSNDTRTRAWRPQRVAPMIGALVVAFTGAAQAKVTVRGEEMEVVDVSTGSFGGAVLGTSTRGERKSK